MATMTNDEILEAIGGKTVLELAELIESFKTKFNVSVAAVAAPAAGAGGGAAAPAAEEQTEFTVILKETGAKKIQVIKVIRDHLAGPQGGQGPGRRRSKDREGRRLEGGGGRDQEEAGRPRRGRRAEVRGAEGRRGRGAEGPALTATLTTLFRRDGMIETPAQSVGFSSSSRGARRRRGRRPGRLLLHYFGVRNA